MKRLLVAVFAVVVLLSHHAARAEEGRPYLGAQAGMFIPIKSSATGEFIGNDAFITYNAGVALTATGGYEFANGLRGEGEFTYRRLTTDRLVLPALTIMADCDIWTYSVMTNLYYDFRNRTRITPFVGAGLGVSVATFGKGESNGRLLWSPDTEVSVAYQGIAGFNFRLSDDTSLDVTYRHAAIPRLHFSTLSADFRGPTLSLGIKKKF